VGTVYGMINGIEGFLGGHYMDLSDVSTEDLEVLRLTPAAYLGSCRYKLPEDPHSPVYPTLFQKFERMDIGALFYIGGNDSMDTVSKLSRYAASVGSDIRFIGIRERDLFQTEAGENCLPCRWTETLDQPSKRSLLLAPAETAAHSFEEAPVLWWKVDKRSGQADSIYTAGDRLTVAVRPGDILLLEE